jgi:putative RNA 2'-phosphotransferase
MEAASKRTSKLISYWLRHHPEDAGLTIDDFGWTSTDQLINALHSRNFTVDLPELLRLTNSFDKVRWEIDEAGGRIRATHGHSFPVLLEDKVKMPPEILYHGTAVKNIPAITEQGLRPMSRQFVHLSETIKTALNVGSRHGKPTLIEVKAGRLANEGWKFYQTSDNVWLTSAIPAEYLAFRR